MRCATGSGCGQSLRVRSRRPLLVCGERVGAGPQAIRIRQTIQILPSCFTSSPGGCLPHWKLTSAGWRIGEKRRHPGACKPLPDPAAQRADLLIAALGSRSVGADQRATQSCHQGHAAGGHQRRLSWWNGSGLPGSALLSLRNCASRSRLDWRPQAAQTARLAESSGPQALVSVKP